jgi:hypothetical protein
MPGHRRGHFWRIWRPEAWKKSRTSEAFGRRSLPKRADIWARRRPSERRQRRRPVVVVPDRPFYVISMPFRIAQPPRSGRKTAPEPRKAIFYACPPARTRGLVTRGHFGPQTRGHLGRFGGRPGQASDSIRGGPAARQLRASPLDAPVWRQCGFARS